MTFENGLCANHIPVAVDDGKERGREIEVGYTFQHGALKSLNLRWRNAVQRRSFGNTNSFNQRRLIIQYPFSIP